MKMRTLRKRRQALQEGPSLWLTRHLRWVNESNAYYGKLLREGVML